jgi:hypothetical protein
MLWQIDLEWRAITYAYVMAYKQQSLLCDSPFWSNELFALYEM